MDNAAPVLSRKWSSWLTKSNSISSISPAVCMAEVLNPRALTYSATFHQCACIGLRASRTLPTIWVHMCRVEAVGCHADQSSSGQGFDSADMLYLGGTSLCSLKRSLTASRRVQHFHCRCTPKHHRSRGFSVKKSHTFPALADPY